MKAQMHRRRLATVTGVDLVKKDLYSMQLPISSKRSSVANSDDANVVYYHDNHRITYDLRPRRRHDTMPCVYNSGDLELKLF